MKANVSIMLTDNEYNELKDKDGRYFCQKGMYFCDDPCGCCKEVEAVEILKNKQMLIWYKY